MEQARPCRLLQGAYRFRPGRDSLVGYGLILVLARFCAPSSELQIAESWYDKTALDDLLGVPGDKINDDRLYRALDALLPHKDDLCRHLQKRYGELFGSTFDFLFYDITSTYFEGTAKGNPQAKRGYSRDSRPDCPQVCIGLVATKEGLPMAFEIFDGNRPDVTTTREMVEIMETKYGKANRVWVMDRGMVSEDNLEFMRTTGARYLVGTPKSLLKKFEQQLLDQNWEEVQPGVEVKLCRSPEGTDETFVLCRSQGRKEKENAILNRFVTRLEDKLNKLADQAQTARSETNRKWSGRSGGFWNGTAGLPLSSPSPSRRAEQEKNTALHRHQEKRRAVPVGAGNRRQLHPAHQLDGNRPEDPVEYLHPAYGSGRLPSVPKNMIWGCGRSSIRNRSGPRPISWSVSLP